MNVYTLKHVGMNVHQRNMHASKHMYEHVLYVHENLTTPTHKHISMHRSMYGAIHLQSRIFAVVT
jgi:hypothetical protein